jgi:hypothetical protein
MLLNVSSDPEGITFLGGLQVVPLGPGMV